MNIESYKKDINDLRKKRDEKSASNPLDWINLAGLFWLEEGDNPFRSDENNKIVMSRFPHSHCGIFNFNDGLVTVQPSRGVNITISGEIPSSHPLRTDREKSPDLMDIGPLTMKIIVREETTLLRVWDRESIVRKNFNGFKYYPANPEYCVTAK